MNMQDHVHKNIEASAHAVIGYLKHVFRGEDLAEVQQFLKSCLTEVVACHSAHRELFKVYDQALLENIWTYESLVTPGELRFNLEYFQSEFTGEAEYDRYFEDCVSEKAVTLRLIHFFLNIFPAFFNARFFFGFIGYVKNGSTEELPMTSITAFYNAFSDELRSSFPHLNPDFEKHFERMDEIVNGVSDGVIQCKR